MASALLSPLLACSPGSDVCATAKLSPRYAPPGSPFADQAVLRILIPLDGKPNQQNRCPRGEVEDIGCTPVYLKVQRKLLSELRNVRGGNAARMAAMRDRGLATALLRRTSVGDIDSRLLDAICTAHGML